MKKVLQYGCEIPEDDELMTYIVFAEAYGWSPKDIEDLEWDKVIKLRELVIEIMKEKNSQMKKVGGDLKGFKL